MVEDHHFAGHGRVVEERFDLAVQRVGDAEVEPNRGAAGELDDVAGIDLLERPTFVVGEIAEFGGAGGGVEVLEINGYHKFG